MKQFKIGDVVYIEIQDLIAVVKERDEYSCMIEYIHSYSHRTFSATHAIGWMCAHAFKMDI
jgi:hypothetical protein